MYTETPAKSRRYTMKPFYRFTFADGYTYWAAGMSAQERRREEAKHGKLISKVKEG